MSGDAVLFAGSVVAPALLLGLTLWFFRRRVRGRAHVSSASLVAGNLLVFLGIASLVFLGGESWFRFVRDTTDGDALTKGSARWFERHWQTNSHHFRDDIEYDFARSGDKTGTRVSFFGDSFTAGHGVEVGRRFVNRVRQARPDWEIHSIADLGASTQTQLLALQRLLNRQYELDLVVLVYSFNDLDPLIPELAGFYRSIARRPPALLQPLVDHSYFANALYYYWKVWRMSSQPGAPNYFEMVEAAYEGPRWDQQKQLLREFHRIVEKHGGRLLVVTFPMLINLGRGLDEDHVMHEKLDAFWEARRVPHLDLLPLLREHRGEQLVVSRFDDHPSAYAHELAADAIIRFIEESGEGPP